MVAMMRAVLAGGPHDVRVAEVEVPRPGIGEVLVEVEACGICGTDLHIAEGEYQPIAYPVILGHEFVGRVAALGAGVRSPAVGDRVVVDPSLYCGHCEYCRAGRDNLCSSGGGLGSTAPGAAAEFVVALARSCYPVPAALSSDEAALVEPLACVVHGFELLPRRTGDHYLVYGAGTMGLLIASVAAASGAGSVSVVDLDGARLPTATAMGAHHVATAADGLPRADAGWDVVVDCSGAGGAIRDALTRLRRGGTYLQFGVAPTGLDVSISPFRLYKEEISLLGSRAVLKNFDAALALLASGAVDVSPLIAASIPLEGFVDALASIARGGAGKILVKPGLRP